MIKYQKPKIKLQKIKARLFFSRYRYIDSFDKFKTATMFSGLLAEGDSGGGGSSSGFS